MTEDVLGAYRCLDKADRLLEEATARGEGTFAERAALRVLSKAIRALVPLVEKVLRHA